MKRPQVTVRDLFWMIVVVACVCIWLRERRFTQEAHREAEKIAIQRDFWITRAGEAQSAAALENCRLRFFTNGISFVRFPHFEITSTVGQPEPEQVTGPEIVPAVP